MKVMIGFKSKVKNVVKLLKSNKGAGFMDVIIGLLIAVVAGGILYALISAFIPDIWGRIANKISSIFGI